MKKLLLSSNGYFALNQIKELVGKQPSQIKLAWIITASKGGVPSFDYLDRHEEQMKELGYDFTRLDIENKTQDELKQALQDKDVVYVDGGNTFYLLISFRATGFDKVIKEFLDRGGLYVGASAGSYLACPTIEMAQWKDSGYDKYGLTDFTGLNYVPFLIFAHYLPEHKDIIKQELPGLRYPLKILQDDQALYVEDGNVEFMGEGEEIIIN